jgi:hypothetical protein
MRVIDTQGGTIVFKDTTAIGLFPRQLGGLSGSRALRCLAPTGQIENAEVEGSSIKQAGSV